MYKVASFEGTAETERWINEKLEEGYVFNGVGGTKTLVRVVVVYNPIKAREIRARRHSGWSEVAA